MTTIEKQIEGHQEEITRLEKIKQEDKNSLLNKTTRITLQSAFINWSGQNIKDVEIRDHSAYYGESVRISMPIGYATFNLVDELHQEGLFVAQVTTHNGEELVILVTNEGGINFMRSEKKKNG